MWHACHPYVPACSLADITSHAAIAAVLAPGLLHMADPTHGLETCGQVWVQLPRPALEEGLFCSGDLSQSLLHPPHPAPTPRSLVLPPRALSSVPDYWDPLIQGGEPEVLGGRGLAKSPEPLPNPAFVEVLRGHWRGFQAGTGELWPQRVRTCRPRKGQGLLRPGAAVRL